MKTAQQVYLLEGATEKEAWRKVFLQQVGNDFRDWEQSLTAFPGLVPYQALQSGVWNVATAGPMDKFASSLLAAFMQLAVACQTRP